MRIGELSDRSGVPVPTIKFYVREGLVPAGVRTQVNQVSYDDRHLGRLRLVRALIQVGGLSVASARRVVSALDDQPADPKAALLTGLGKTQYAIAEPEVGADSQDMDALETQRVDRLISHRGWTIGPHNPSRVELAKALTAGARLGMEGSDALLDSYADAAGMVAEADLDGALTGSPEESVERLLIRLIIGDRILMALRRLAQESAARARLSADPSE